jgi:hypothetical protein
MGRIVSLESLLEDIASLSITDQKELLKTLAQRLKIEIDPIEFTNTKAALLVEEIQRIDRLEWDIRGLVLTTIKVNDVLYLVKDERPDLQFKILEMEIYGHLMSELESGDHPKRIRVQAFVEIPILNFIWKLYKDRE